jgi:signal transduction histidine kinase
MLTAAFIPALADVASPLLMPGPQFKLVSAVIALLLGGTCLGLAYLQPAGAAAERRLLYGVSAGWVLNCLYLVVELVKGAWPGPTLEFVSDAFNSCGNGLAMWASVRYLEPAQALWRWLVAGGLAAALASAWAVDCVLVDAPWWAFALKWPAALFDAAAWACVAAAVARLVSVDLSASKRAFWFCVLPLRAYAVLQVFSPLDSVPEGPGLLVVVVTWCFLAGSLCKLGLLVGLAGYGGYTEALFRRETLLAHQQAQLARQEAQLAGQQLELARLEGQGRVIAQMIHELVNPAIVLGSLLPRPAPGAARPDGLPLDSVDVPAVLELIYEILAVVEGAHEEIKFSQQDAAGVRPTSERRRHVQLNNLIQAAIVRVKLERPAQPKGKKIVVRRQFHANTLVTCVDHEIRRVFINLLKNAYDALAARGGLIRITTGRKRAQDGSQAEEVVVKITDDGEGIAPENLAKIRAESFSTRDGPGRGHGLAICRQILDRHGGTIDLFSPPEGRKSGTTVSVTLPAE